MIKDKTHIEQLHDYKQAIQRLAIRSEIINFEGLVSWRDMTSLSIPIGETQVIKDTFNTPLLADMDHWVWNTVIPPGKGFYPAHKHDFVEICVVLEGVLTEELTKHEYTKGDYVIYEVMRMHHPCNAHQDDCRLHVHWVNSDRVDDALHKIENYYNNKTNKDELQ